MFTFVICNRNKFITVSDNLFHAYGLGGFFKNLGKKGSNTIRKMSKNGLKN